MTTATTTRTTTAKVLVLAAAFAAATAAGATIEQGFALDGVTTYCQGVKGGANIGALGLGELPADSAGKCPVAVALTVPATTVKQRAVVAVTWTAKANAGVPNNRFPSSVDAGTKIPKSVTASWLKACKVGTDCGSVVDGAPTGPANAESGPFDARGSKDLRANQFTFNEVGDFIIVGKLVLPGDESLKISATEYVVLEKVTVVDANAVITPTPTPAAATPAPTPGPSTPGVTAVTSAPPPSGANGGVATGATANPSIEDNVMFPKATTPAVVATVKPGGDGGLLSTDTPSTSAGGSNSLDANTSTSSGFFASNSVLLGCVLAGCFVACVIGFAFVMRRRSETKMMAAKRQAPDAPDNDSVGMLESGDFAAAKYMENQSSRHQDPAPPRRMTSSPPVVFDASVRGSELSISSEELTNKQRDVSEVSSLASEAYSDTLSTFDDASRPTQDQYLGNSFDWKRESDDQSNFSIASKPRGFSTASALSDLSEGPRESRLASEVSVDSYAFAPSPRESAADSYAGGYARESAADSYAGGYARESAADSYAGGYARESAADSYAFAPSPRESAADSYLGGYSESSSRISGMSVSSDVSSVRDT